MQVVGFGSQVVQKFGSRADQQPATYNLNTQLTLTPYGNTIGYE